MSEMRVSDPSKLHLLRKEELTQIRKAARVLRDPGTTSSWKSPLATSSRSAAAIPRAPKKNGLHARSDFPLPPPAPVAADDKKVFLSNWNTYKSSADRPGTMGKNDGDGVGVGGSSSPSSSVGTDEDSLSYARNGAADSRSDTSLGDKLSSMIFRCNSRDAANLVSSSSAARASVTRTTGFKKKKNGKKIGKSKKVSTTSSANFDALSRYQHNQMISNRSNLLKVKGQPNSKSMPLGLGLSRGNSVDQSEDDDDCSNSEDLGKLSGASPLLMKLKQRKNWSQSSSRLLKTARKDDSSYTYSTPALSTSSYNRYVNHNPSTVGSWDATTASLNDDDDGDDHLDLPGSRGCGIPCYWSKRTPKHRVCRSCYSPSLSDTIRRKGSSILYGRQNMYHRRHLSSSGPNKRRIDSRSAQGILPLLTSSADGRGGSSIGTGLSDDELSTNFGELDLEALSRLDGRRWSSSCRSQEGLEIVALNGEGEEEGTPENIKSLSQKYKPMFFDELIGQNIVVQSLTNAVSRGRIAPMYLFQGPRGTGKTSAARIFAAALNCVAKEDTKPCGYCSECSDFFSGRSRDLWEVDGTTKKGIDRVRHLLRKLLAGSPSAFIRYKVFVIDECHLLPSKTWLTFLKFLEDPPQRVVFLFITTDLDNVPRTIQSRCQKYHFNKIKDVDIVSRLRNISSNENLDVESDALDLIALNTDGSLRDAETMLDQLSLLGKRITTALVNELVGVVSDDKLLELLELAMSSDTAETVKRARELMDSGVDPTVLMSQMASLIMDIIAGTYKIVDAKDCDSVFGGRSLTEAELERLKHALKLLSEAEKQIRISSERSTWFTATLLQLGSVASSEVTQSCSSRRQSSKTTEEDPSSASREATSYRQKSDAQHESRKSTSPASLHKAVYVDSCHVDMMDGCSFDSKPSHRQFMDGSASASHYDAMIDNMISRCTNSEKLDDIWAQCIERCHSMTLRQLLHSHGKLLSISEVEGLLVAYVAFCDGDIKTRAERFMSSITNSIETVLRRSVEVRIILLPDGEASIDYLHAVGPLEGRKQMGKTVAIEREKESLNAGDLVANTEISVTKEKSQEIPMQRIESIIREQRLETAWLQTADKGTPSSLSRLKPEKNQVLPQDGTCCPNQMESKNSSVLSSQHWEDELNHELKVLKVDDVKALQKDQIGRRADHYPMSPSLLHDSSLVANFNKDNMGYESGSGSRGCSALFCWKNKHPKQATAKGTPIRARRGGRLALFGNCGKSKKI